MNLARKVQRAATQRYSGRGSQLWLLWVGEQWLGASLDVLAVDLRGARKKGYVLIAKTPAASNDASGATIAPARLSHARADTPDDLVQPHLMGVDLQLEHRKVRASPGLLFEKPGGQEATFGG